MSNTYAINTVRGKEYVVAEALIEMGLRPWVPSLLVSKKVKEKPEPIWFDRAYVPKLIFCVFPPISWPDVMGVKHIVGKPFSFTQSDIDGRKAGFITHPKPNEHILMQDETGNHIPISARAGLKDFKDAVDAEYADAARHRANNEYQCQYVPGQALEMLGGAFEGLPATFLDVVRRAHEDFAKLRVDLEFMGGIRTVEVSPDKVGAI